MDRTLGRPGSRRRRLDMAEKGTVWFCELCGQKVKVIEEGGGVLVCCGQEMILVKD
jgi:desulfoferrodoxin-like iron-binding protein